MVVPPIETPRTEVGNVTYMSRLADLSVAESFHSPSNGQNDLLKQIQGNKRGSNFRTPSSRAPFADRRNVTTTRAQGEFTPLMKSTTKANMRRQGSERRTGMPQTPGVLKPGYRGEESPALPENSRISEENTGNSFGTEDSQGTPVPQIPSSSVASTPLAVLPRRDYRGSVLTEGANVLTLKEQEQTINKIEKENFNLKMKITFLEKNLDKLRVTGAEGFNEIALRENTELKIAKVTMQKELRQHRKTLGAAEHDLEAYRQQLAEVQEKVRRKHADQGQREEMDELRKDAERKEGEIQALREKVESLEGQHGDVKKMRDEIIDLEADLREKERFVEEKDEQIDELKEQVDKEADAVDSLEAELKAAQRQLQDLEQEEAGNEQQAKALEEAQDELEQVHETAERLKGDLKRAQAEAATAREERQKADEDKNQFEADLIELRDELANKSLSSKGLSHQLEERVNKSQQDLQALRSDYSDLQKKHEDKSRLSQALQGRLDELEHDMDLKEQSMKDQFHLARQERDKATRERQALASQLQESVKNLQHTNEEKDLLQSRHDSLTTESQSLQKDLVKAQKSVSELNEKLNNEKRLAVENERALRQDKKDEVERLAHEMDELRHDLDDRERQFDEDQESWDIQRRALESQREKAEEKAAGLKRTIEKLQETEGTLSGNEMNLRKALESEKQRHEDEEAVLNRQIQELSNDVETRRQALEEARSELTQVREELRKSRRAEDALNEKVQGLEDEIDVLQLNLDEESEQAREQLTNAKQETETLKRRVHTLKQDLTKAELARADARAELEAFQGSLHDEEGSKEHISQRLREVETQLNQVKREKQSLQDALADVNIEMHSLRASIADVEAERDEVRSQLRQTQEHAEGTLRLDQEKADLRKSNIRLESDISRLKGEQKGLLEMKEAAEKDLEREIHRASVEEGRLIDEIARLQKQSTVAAEGMDKDLLSAKRSVQRLETRNAELELRIEQQDPTGQDAAAELSMVRRDLKAVRVKEMDYIKREATYKERTRDLQRRVTDLERQLHDVETAKLAVDSSPSSIGGSARKNEIVEVRRQLSEALQQMKELRSRAKESEREAQRKVLAAERDSQAKIDAYEQDRELLEQELADNRLQQDEYLNQNKTSEQTVARLRLRISHLENELHNARLTNGDNTIAEERKDLHVMLKDAKLEVEDLQMQITDRDSRIESSVLREKDLRTQLKRTREERTLLSQKANAANAELDSLQRRYERALDKMATLQHEWDDERKAITQRVRFPNTSISSLHPSGESTALVRLEQDIQAKEIRHQAEIKGLAKQIQYLRAKCGREEGFRADLAYSKKFFLMQIELYNACNRADLQMLEEIGITPDRSIREKRPSLRSVGWMVLASVRMRKMQTNWAGNKKIHASLAKKVEQMRRRSGKSVAR
ncbi:MAG: hypothetical protein M1836_000495 [Candelina mexicana]|nr:MAG: hypothetical protein M1836_000495 [Candelina mexicana]